MSNDADACGGIRSHVSLVSELSQKGVCVKSKADRIRNGEILCKVPRPRCLSTNFASKFC